MQDPVSDHCGESALAPGSAPKPLRHPAGRVCQTAWRSGKGHTCDLWPQQTHSRLPALHLYDKSGHNPGPAAGFLQVTGASFGSLFLLNVSNWLTVNLTFAGLHGTLTPGRVLSTCWWRCRVSVVPPIFIVSLPWASTCTSRPCCVLRWARLTAWRHSRYKKKTT